LTHVAQVGGNHYAADYQHWDWVEDLEMGYLEGNATKYLVRWRSKNGLQDLKKARSYIMKLLTRHQEHGRKNRCRFKWSVIAQFFEANGVPAQESALCSMIAQWTDSQSIYNIMEGISELIAVNYPETTHSHSSGVIPEFLPSTVEAPEQE
jgi:hypothetical protein